MYSTKHRDNRILIAMTSQKKGRPPNQKEIFYLQWGLETLKNNIKLSNDILKQLLTLSSAMLGVSIIFETIIVTEWIKILVLLSFLLSLIVAFIGILPYERKVNLDSPNDIQKHKISALKHKRCYLWISASFLTIGFAAIVTELIVLILK